MLSKAVVYITTCSVQLDKKSFFQCIYGSKNRRLRRNRIKYNKSRTRVGHGSLELSVEEESRVSDAQQTTFARQTSHDDTMDESQTEDFSNEGGSVGDEAAGGVEANSQGKGRLFLFLLWMN